MKHLAKATCPSGDHLHSVIHSFISPRIVWPRYICSGRSFPGLRFIGCLNAMAVRLVQCASGFFCAHSAFSDILASEVFGLLLSRQSKQFIYHNDRKHVCCASSICSKHSSSMLFHKLTIARCFFLQFPYNASRGSIYFRTRWPVEAQQQEWNSTCVTAT